MLLLRSRLGLDYHFSNTAHVRLEMLDTRYWSKESPQSAFPASKPFHDEFELRQAFLEWRHKEVSRLANSCRVLAEW